MKGKVQAILLVLLALGIVLLVFSMSLNVVLLSETQEYDNTEPATVCIFRGNYREDERILFLEAAKISDVEIRIDAPTSEMTEIDPNGETREVQGISLWICGNPQETQFFWDAYDFLTEPKNNV